MAANFVDTGQDFKVVLQSGETGYASGKPYLIGDILGVITKLSRPVAGNPDGRTVFKDEASAAGDIAIVHLKGIWTLPKTTGAAIGAGVKVYWDGTGVTATASTNKEIGWAEWNLAQSNGGYLSADTLVNVKLKG